jgi:hypothetical protein
MWEVDALEQGHVTAGNRVSPVTASLAHASLLLQAERLGRWGTVTVPAVAKEIEVDLIGREFEALRAEIIARTGAQHTLLNLHVTIIGAILGLALSATASPLVLLVVPVVAISMGFLYLDHHVHVRRIGVYINTILRPAAERHSGGRAVWQWEEFESRPGWRKSLPPIVIWTPIVVLFLVVPLLASIFAAPAVNSSPLWIAWSIGILANLLLVVAAVLIAKPGWRSSYQTR